MSSSMQSFGFGSTLAVGQSFGSFSPRGARSKGDQQPDGRVAHNQKLQNILGVDIGILATQALRARKTRKLNGSPGRQPVRICD
jgi:hypothetical protein